MLIRGPDEKEGPEVGLAWRTTVAAALGAVLVLPSPGRAQTPLSPDSAVQVVLDSLPGEPLALREAQGAAIRGSAALRQAEAAYRAASGSARREAGAFDPELFFQASRLEEDQPSSSFFAGAPTLSTTATEYRTGLRLTLPIGTDLEVGLNASRLETNSSFAFLNPEHQAYGSVGVRQPILGGFHRSARKGLVRAERERDAAKERYEQALLAIVSATERAYWDLYAAERDLAVQVLALGRARLFLRETELRASAGLVGPGETASARTFLAEQELLLFDREEQLDRLSDRFSSMTGLWPPAGTTRFAPTDGPPGEIAAPPLAVVLRAATEGNRDLRAAGQEVEAAKALSRAAFWEALPEIDLTGSLRGRGLSGEPRDVVFLEDTLRSEIEERSIRDAALQAASRDFPGWSVGVEVTIPLGFREGLGEKKRLDAEVVRAEQRRIELGRVLEEEVRAAHREVSRSPDRLRAAAIGVDAAEEQVRIGLIEFHNGRSTAFELVRLSEDLAVAERRYSDALVRAAKAAATLRELTAATIP